MLFTELFNGRDMCNVCGQTPCNCTHIAESADPQSRKLGRIIGHIYNEIYDMGDDALDYLNDRAPVWAELWDRYEGDIDSIIAEEDPVTLGKAALELKDILNDLQSDQGVAEGFFGIDDKIKGKIQNIVSRLSDEYGMWDHKAQTFTPDGLEHLKSILKFNDKYIKYALSLTSRDFEAEGVAEGEVVPFKRPQPQALTWKQLPKDVLVLANDWYWAEQDNSGVDALMDPDGFGNGTANELQYITAKLQQHGWNIDYNDEDDAPGEFNLKLTNKRGQTVLLSIEDAQDFTGWAAGTNPVSEEKVRLDPKCWKGKKIGNPKTKMKGGVRVNNCVPAESLNEFAPNDGQGGEEDILHKYARIWYNGDESTQQKVEQVLSRQGWEIGEIESEEGGAFVVRSGDENGDSYIGFAINDLTEGHENGEYSDEAGMAHTNLITIARAANGLLNTIDQHEDLPEWVQEKIAKVEGMLVTAWDYLKSQEAQGIDPRITEVFGHLKEDWQRVTHQLELTEEFDLIESIVESIAERNGVDAEVVWADLESLTEDELYVFAVTSEPIMEDWQKVNKKDKTDGMSRKAVNAYRRENPGSKLKTAVTTKPSKLKKGSKASKRRKSYCSRSRGQMKMHSISCSKTPDKAICKARRRWNCEGVDLSDQNVVAEARDGDTNFGHTVTRGSWVVYDGSKVKRFKTHTGAKAYAEKNGGKVASSEFYADKIQKQGVAEVEKNPHTSALGKALYRDLSKEKKASPAQVERNKLRWAQRQKAKAEQPPTKGMSNAEKVDKGWRNPNINEGGEKWIKLPNGNYRNMHTGVTASKPTVKKKRGEKTGAEWDAIEKAKKDKEQDVAEGAEFGAYYYEQLAQQVFDTNPNLTDENEILNLGYKIAKGELGSRAQGMFRDEDFPSDFVSSYGYLKKQGVAEGSKKIPASNKPVDPKDLVVSLKDVPVKKPRGHKQYDPANEFPGVKAFKKQGVAEVSDATLTSYLTKVDADSQKHDRDPSKRSAEKRNKSVSGFARAFNKLDARKEKTDEGQMQENDLAQQMLALAKKISPNARLAGTPDEERERTRQMLAKRAADRAAAPPVEPEPIGDEERTKLELQLKDLEAQFDPNYEYIDAPSGGEWRKHHEIAQQIARIKKRLAVKETQDEDTLSGRNDIVESLRRLREADPAYTGIDPVVRSRMGMPPASQDEIRSFLDKNPPVVTSGSGAPVTSGSGQPVQSGGAVDVAKAADAASPDRAAAVAKPAGSTAVAAPSTPAAPAAPATPAVATPVTPPTPITPKPIPQSSAATTPAPSFSKGVTDIAAANKISDPNKINVGQSIKLPSGQNYTVAKGDTLSGINAGQFKGTAPSATPTPAPTPAKPASTTVPNASMSTPPKTTATPTQTNVPAAKNIYVPNISGAGQKGPTVAAATGSDVTNPINKTPYGTGNSAPPPVMFNKMPPGATGAITKEGESKSERPEADYGDDYQQMVLRLKKLAGAGPLKTVYDPAKRVYKNVPTAVQPPKK